MAGEIKTGTYTGTGAAINIELGWVPDKVEVLNMTDGDASWVWYNGFGAGDAFQTANHDTAQQSLITSNGIDAYEPTNFSNKPGFTVGTSLSESAKVFYYTAYRSGEY